MTLQEKMDRWNQYISDQKRIIRKGNVIPMNLFKSHRKGTNNP